MGWNGWMAPKADLARLPLWLLAIGLSLSACGKAPPTETAPDNAANTFSTDAANALEALASESGVITENRSDDPAGSYGRAYDGGEDRLCLRPDPHSDLYRAGVEIRIGEEEYCRGSGTAQRAGGRVILTLAGGRCSIVAQDEGDRIVLPGAVDLACASLCSARGSLAGVTFPRISAGPDAAARVLANDGKPLCK